MAVAEPGCGAAPHLKMDNLTHTLFGATLARTPLNRAGRGTTAALILASNAPDIDIVTAVERRARLSAVAPGADARTAWRRRARHARRRHRLGRQPPARPRPDGDPCVLPIARARLDRRRPLPRADGSADLVRHASPQPVRLALVRGRPDADHRHLPARGARRVLLVRQPAGMAAQKRRDRAVADGAQLWRPHRAPIARRSTSRRACSVRRCPGAARLRDTRGRSSTAGRSTDHCPTTDRERRCLLEIAALPTFTSPFQWRLVAQLSNAYETRDIDLVELALRPPPTATGSAVAARAADSEPLDAGGAGGAPGRTPPGFSSASHASLPRSRPPTRKATQPCVGPTSGSPWRPRAHRLTDPGPDSSARRSSSRLMAGFWTSALAS